MNWTRSTVLVLSLLVPPFLARTGACAQPVPSFVYDPSPVHVGEVITFDGTASICDTPTCGYHWTWKFVTSGGATLNGGQMGDGQVIHYAFDAFAASKPYVIVVLTVTSDNSTHNFRNAQASFVVDPAVVGVNPPSPAGLELRSPAPNPVLDATSIVFGLPTAATVRLEVFDLSGRLVRTLASGRTEAGLHPVRWDRTDDHGRVVQPGVYYARVYANGRKWS